MSIRWSPDSEKLVAYRRCSGYNRQVHYVLTSPADQLQPKDTSIFYRKPGEKELTELVKVEGNHQRLRRHHFKPVEAEAVRIHVRATNGDSLARIFEVRCYE